MTDWLKANIIQFNILNWWTVNELFVWTWLFKLHTVLDIKVNSIWHISCHRPFSIPPKNVRKLKFFGYFQEVQKKSANMKLVKLKICSTLSIIFCSKDINWNKNPKFYFMFGEKLSMKDKRSFTENHQIWKLLYMWQLERENHFYCHIKWTVVVLY